MRTYFFCCPIFYIFFVLMLAVSGCDLAKPQVPVADNPVPAVPATAADAAAAVPETEAQPPAPIAEKPKPETELVKADVGAGKKGHYGQKGGEDATDIITVPVATLFRAKEMTAYRIQVPQALQLYKASNDGKCPATNEEFMEKIIRANNIPLPELPDGQRYVYDPEKEELMVEKPKVQ